MMGKPLKESLNARVWQQKLPFLQALPGENSRWHCLHTHVVQDSKSSEERNDVKCKPPATNKEGMLVSHQPQSSSSVYQSLLFKE